MGSEVVAHQRALVGGHALGAGDVGADVIALVDRVENVADVLLHAFRRDAVFGIVLRLLLAAAVGLGHRPLHRAGDVIGIENDLAVDVARGTADGLHQRGFRTQEAFLIRVQNGHQPALGNIQPFAQTG